MIRNAYFSIAALGVTVLLAGCAESSSSSSSAPAASVAPASNTAEICESSGTAARDVVVDLFAKMGEVADEPDPEAALAKVYTETFGKLGTQMRADAARATDPAFVAVLTGIADAAAGVAASPDNPDTAQFEDAIGKLDQFCPSAGESSAPVAGATGTSDAGTPVGTVCDLPVTFDLADDWNPKKVDVAEDDPLAALTKKGTLRLACEIDAKPAGHIGFLRVWTGPSKQADLRGALKPFLTESKTRKVVYTPVTAGGLDGLDVSFEQYQKLTEEWLPHRAFAVNAGSGVIALDLGGLDAAEHKAMLPAYELATKTLTVT
ncbi:lipoprotein [Actinoplanes sp. CA-015351]|uniref:lipoprotein n=1 Tax=Actinoplanes sp. CA-015351 TaxID=3239897 RepID=UPI003D9646D7